MERPDIDKMKARIEAATQGPWISQALYIFQEELDKTLLVSFDQDIGNDMRQRFNDNDFTAAARTDLPECIAYIKYLENEITKLNQ